MGRYHHHHHLVAEQATTNFLQERQSEASKQLHLNADHFVYSLEASGCTTCSLSFVPCSIINEWFRIPLLPNWGIGQWSQAWLTWNKYVATSLFQCIHNVITLHCTRSVVQFNEWKQLVCIMCDILHVAWCLSSMIRCVAAPLLYLHHAWLIYLLTCSERDSF